MKHIDIINACSDLGANVAGTKEGPKELTKNLEHKNLNNIYFVEQEETKRETQNENKKKNLNAINIFNEKLYKQESETQESGRFPLTLGGDHSIAIASALASIKKHKKMGIIWVDAHPDYHTFDSTISGNIHGMPLAVITNYEKRYLADFHDGNFYNPKNAVVVNARDVEESELENLKDAGVTIFTSDDIKDQGIKSIMRQAIKIASEGCEGIHISYDLDIIDPEFVPGLSYPVKGGIDLEEAFDIIDEIIKNKDILKSMDIVEFCPSRDKDNKTKIVACKMIQKLLNNL